MSRIVAVALLVAAVACKRDEPPPGVRDVEIADPAAHCGAEGFVRLQPPTHLPTSAPAIDQVEIWLQLPPTGEIQWRPDAGGLWFPPGTVADRVEFDGTGAARRIVDVRGSTVREDGGQDFHVYRPASMEPGARLIGVEWSRDDPSRQAPATARFVQRLAEVPPYRDAPAARREAWLTDVRNKNACLPCHTPGRATNDTLGQHGLVNRGTDASGFFTPATVLVDEVPLETYGVDDRSTSDPALRLRCGDRDATDDEISSRHCSGDQVMTGRIQWPLAWAQTPKRAAAICSSRAVLLSRLAATGRAQFAGAADPCESAARE